MKISDYLKIQPGVTALIGGGGKTSLMYKLAGELAATGTVIICTSTKIYEPENILVLTNDDKERITGELNSRRVLCVGTKASGGKLSEPLISFRELKELADYVIVEADGAHGLPIKAHADYEPVIPEGTDQTVLVIGADAFGAPISAVCHRPELFAQIAGVNTQSIVTPGIAARVITSERFGDCLYINKVEDERAVANARSLADMLDMPVTAGSLKTEEYICLR